jgi:8-oxo-dGTP pyrophosphatase MutT (NUDIX family)
MVNRGGALNVGAPVSETLRRNLNGRNLQCFWLQDSRPLSISPCMPRQERSAGIVLFHPETPRRYLLLDYGKHWDFPKGHLEKKESDLQAALRELEEETGISDPDIVPGFAHEIRYFFKRGKRVIGKSVIFFLAQSSQTKIKLSDEHVDYAFLDFPSALDRLTYPNAREVLRLAEEFLSR